MKLYSAWYCPFAQRAWMALLHKGVAFEYIEIDPYKKTEQWLQLSRNTGQVPVLIPEGRKSIVGSTRIVELVDQLAAKDSPLFSADPLDMAEQNFWIDYVGQHIIPYFYRFLKNDVTTEEGELAKQKMLKGIVEFSQAMNQDGPYFSGENISAVDISFIPFAYRITVLLKHYRNFELPTDGEHWQRYHRWYRANIEQTVFKKTASDKLDFNARLIDFYLPYSQGGGQEDVTVLPSTSGSSSLASSPSSPLMPKSSIIA